MAFRFRPISAPGRAQAGATTTPVQTTVQNLLTHVPGEASGFYLLALEGVRQASASPPTVAKLGVLFALALTILIVVRVLAHSGWVQLLTSAGAFALWMVIFQDGFLRHYLDPNHEWTGVLLAVAAFYSVVVTLLANAGKLK